MAKPTVEAIVFDLDGTLTLPHALDFDLMRRRVGAPAGRDILDYVHSLDAEGKAKALAAIESVEVTALDKVELQPHLAECMERLSAKGLRRAIITRNGPHAVEHFLDKSSQRFEHIVTRDFLPCKPAPDPFLHVADTLQFEPSKAIMVGDSMDDLGCGRAAGAHTVLILNERNAHLREHADHAVSSLLELADLVDGGFQTPR